MGQVLYWTNNKQNTLILGGLYIMKDIYFVSVTEWISGLLNTSEKVYLCGPFLWPTWKHKDCKSGRRNGGGGGGGTQD